jgi:hypothetical protein
VSDWAPFEWQSPVALKLAAEFKRSVLGPLSMKGPGQDFREAFVASRFAEFRGGKAVKLLRPRPRIPTPDFAILMETGEELWFETTEIDRPDRRRGDEEALDPGENNVPDEHWVVSDQYAQTVAERVSKKAQKNYDKCDGLIIWSNAFPIDDDEKMTIQWWQEASRPAATIFPETWVHFQGSFNQLFYNNNLLNNTQYPSP